MLDIFKYAVPLDDWIAYAVDLLVGNFRPQFQAVKMPIAWMLNGLNEFLLWMPPEIILLIFLLAGWKAAGWKIGVFSLIGMTFIGFTGLWDETMTTLAMVISAVFVDVLIGVPVGIVSSRSDRVESFVRPILDAMQTTPAFVYLVPVVMLFSIGTVAGVIATIIFSMPPIIRLTNLGIRQVHPELIEATYSFGATKRQVLWKVQVPLAMPTIMAGLNQTIMLSLSMVVIASLIGAGGLGVPVFEGLNSLQVGLAGIGGLGIVLMAMVLDRITQALGTGKKQE
ncbi:MAG: proline/glycine betaine ABC transporter permease [Desulfobacteraceae bacterium]|nr:proline/glycine betaine ABC transporter permease [Desulfobacteraceae bacterium]